MTRAHPHTLRATLAASAVALIALWPRVGPAEVASRPPLHTLRTLALPRRAQDSAAEPRRTSSAQPSAATPAGSASISFAAARRLSAEQSQKLFDAEERAVEACMRERGFAYAPVPMDARLEEEARRMPAPGDLAAAEAQGYGLAAGTHAEDAQAPKDPNDAIRASLAPTEREAWLRAVAGDLAVDPSTPVDPARHAVLQLDEGTVSWDRDACWARAREALYGDDEGFQALDVELRLLRRALSDGAATAPESVAALASWRRCMASRGFAWASPAEAREALAERAARGDDDALQEEKRTAVADALCDRAADLSGTRARVQARLERGAEAEHQELMQSYVQQRAAALARADEILGGATPW